MTLHFHTCTLVARNAICWSRAIDDTITVRRESDGPVLTRFTADQYEAVIDLITSRPEGTQLGALADGDVPADSLGRLMASFGKPRSHASWVAAVAVDEGYADHEYRGRRNGGLWLFPAEERAPSDEDHQRPPSAPGSGQGVDPTLGSADAASALRDLADRVENTPLADANAWSIDLADATSANCDATLEQVSTWERAVDDGRYVYRFDVDDGTTTDRCVDALSAAKARNVGRRCFSRVNRNEHPSCCLYIGSSRRLTNRMRQHLGLAHAGTYAMHVAHWRTATPLTGPLRLTVFRLPSDVEDDVVQAIEDGLWRASRPVFGRLGSR